MNTSDMCTTGYYSITVGLKAVLMFQSGRDSDAQQTEQPGYYTINYVSLKYVFALQTEHAHLKLAQKVVKGLTKLDSAAPFLTPVSEEAAPGYHSVVKESMDLGTVLNKLKIGAYSSLGKLPYLIQRKHVCM